MRRFVLLALLACGCQASTAEKGPDRTDFYEHQPTSILVLPALNETSGAGAPLDFSTTIQRYVAERGYYVFPVQPTLAILEANGIHEGGELDSVEAQKFHEILGADALLCVTIQSWDTGLVAMHYRLVDARSGTQIWETSRECVETPNTYSGDGFGMALTMLAGGAGLYNPRTLAHKANRSAMAELPPGPLSKEHDKAKAELLARSKPAAAKPKP